MWNSVSNPTLSACLHVQQVGHEILINQKIFEWLGLSTIDMWLVFMGVEIIFISFVNNEDRFQFP